MTGNNKNPVIHFLKLVTFHSNKIALRSKTDLA